MAAESLEFPDESFDFVFGNGLLHHVDIEAALREVYRVLRKKGKAVFSEPLAYNPVIQIYRRMARNVRTPTERPLTLHDIHTMERVFPRVKHTEYQLCTLLIFVWFHFGLGISPSEQRYWKKIIEESERWQKPFERLQRLDHWLFKLLPPIRYLSWNTVIELEK